MRNWASSAFTVAIVVIIAINFWIDSFQRRFDAPGPLAATLRFEVPKGAGLTKISRDLEEKGAVSSAWLFSSATRKLGAAARLKAGDYDLPAEASMREILDILTEGKAVQYRFTAAEGLTSWQIVEALRQEPELTGEIEEVPAEGVLAPDTYFFHKGESRSAVLARMEAAQTELLERLWTTRDPDLPLKTPEEALILASIVEKETGVDAERGLVASVFVNRMRLDMRLQTDPTVIYGITRGEGPLGRGLRRSELDDASNPYNTYQMKGLPPGPIANPGRAAIAATLNPPESEFLFFVADGGGGHSFAKTLQEHNKNVAVWRRIEAARKAAE